MPLLRKSWVILKMLKLLSQTRSGQSIFDMALHIGFSFSVLGDIYWQWSERKITSDWQSIGYPKLNRIREINGDVGRQKLIAFSWMWKCLCRSRVRWSHERLEHLLFLVWHPFFELMSMTRCFLKRSEYAFYFCSLNRRNTLSPTPVRYFISQPKTSQNFTTFNPFSSTA